LLAKPKGDEGEKEEEEDESSSFMADMVDECRLA